MCLISAGKAPFIKLIANTTAAIALTQEVRTATFVNHLAKKNVPSALSIQEDLDRHLEQWTDALYTIQIIRAEVQSFRRSHLKCHAKYLCYF